MYGALIKHFKNSLTVCVHISSTINLRARKTFTTVYGQGQNATGPERTSICRAFQFAKLQLPRLSRALSAHF